MRVFAPFASEVVEAVNTYQATADYPYMCGCGGSGAKLIAFNEGLICERGHASRTFVDLPTDAFKSSLGTTRAL